MANASPPASAGSSRCMWRARAARISMCHCLACQRRTGAPFSAQSRFAREQVREEGESRTWVRTADTGNRITQH